MKLQIFVLILLMSFSIESTAGSLFGGVGGDYLNPRIERSEAGSSSFSTASELSYQGYVTLGYQGRKKKHSLRGTYMQKFFELEAPTTRTFSELEHDFVSYSVMYNYSGKSLDFYLEYLNDSAFIFENQQFITTFTPTPVENTFGGIGLRLKAYSDKPHNLFSYMKYRNYKDSRGSKVSYNKGFRLILDFAYYQQISSEEAFGLEVEYKTKLKAGLKIEKGGFFNYGLKLNFISEEYEWEDDTYTLIDVGGGIFLKFNY